MTDLSDIEVIAPNFKRHHSGVTSTIVRLLPLMTERIAITSSGPDLPPDVPNVHWTRFVTMSRRGPSGYRVWHARRNVEMVAGLVLKILLRKKLRLLFTSAAQRRHSTFTRWLIRNQDALIATSLKSVEYLEKGAIIIPHGVDCAVFRPADDKCALRQSLGLPTGTLIGCFGRIRHQKGTDLFIEALLRVLPEIRDVHVLVMGRSTAHHAGFLASLKSRVAQAGLSERIRFKNEVSIEDLARHFRALDIFIAPQRWEGFGLTPLEAMASGVPVIASRAGVFEDLVKDGATGRLVKTGDVDAIEAAIRELLSNPSMLDNWSTEARRHVELKFRLEQEADAILGVYARLLGHNE